MIDLYFSKLKNSEAFAKEIFSSFYRMHEPKFYRNDHGKPFLVGDKLFFSLSHSFDTIALAVSESPVGLDVESLRANKKHAAVSQRFSAREQEDILDERSFLNNWTAKESYVKYKGVSLLPLLSSLEFFGSALYESGQKIDISLQNGCHRSIVFTVCARDKQPIVLHDC